MSWQEITDGLDCPDARRKLEATSELQEFLSQSTLSPTQTRELVGYVCNIISDSNMKICERGLSLASQFLVLMESSSDFRTFVPSLLAAVGEKLGDAKHGIRQEACTLLGRIGKTCGGRYILGKILESGWWSHKNWRIRQGAASVAAEVSSKAGIENLTDEQRHQLLIEPCLGLLEDPNSSVRDSASDCLEELFLFMGQNLLSALKRYTIQPATVRDLTSRFEARQQRTSTLPDAPVSQAIPSNSSDRRHSSSSKMNSKTSGVIDGDQCGLQRIEPVRIDTERELKEEIQRIIEGLALSEEWDKRILSLARLEGLLRGGAARLDCCSDLLKPLKDPLTAQINDRRSAVSRQACHLVASMAAALGSKFEPDAIFFLPVVFKVLIITVQVMADAADLCVHSILRYCRGGRLVPKICDVLVSDRNSKSRQHCSKFLLQVLEEWPKVCYERQLESIENGIKSASQDTTSETRSVGRLAFCAYSKAYPDRAKSFLKKLDGGLQLKLSASLSDYQPGNVHFRTIDPLPEDVLPLAWQADCVHSSNAHTPRSMMNQKSNLSMSTPRKKTSNLLAGCNQVAAISNALSPITEAATEKSFPTMSAVTAPIATVDKKWPVTRPCSEEEPPGNSERLQYLGGRRLSVYGGPQRCKTDIAHGSIGSIEGEDILIDVAQKNIGTPVSVSSAGVLESPEVEMQDQEQQPGAGGDESAEERRTNAREQSVMIGIELSRLLNLSQIQEKTDWQGKVDVLDEVHALLENSGSGSLQLGHEAYRVTQYFESRIEDAHFRVVEKALRTLRLVIMRMPQIFSMYLDRLVPPLFYKLVDQKDHIQKQSKQALEAVALSYKADSLLPALIRALESMKVPRGHLAILEFFCMCLGRDAPAGIPTISTILRQWIGRIVSFLSDKNLDVRRMAVNALQNVHENMDPSALTSYFVQSSPQDQAVLRKILGPLFVDVTFPEPRQTLSAQKGKPLQTISTPQPLHHQPTVPPAGYNTGDHKNQQATINPRIGTGEGKSVQLLQNVEEGRNVTNFDWIIGKLVSGHLSRDVLENAMLHVKLADTERLKPTFAEIMSNLVRNLGNGNDGLQQCILGLLKRLILHHSSLINVESVGELIQALLDSGAGRPRKVYREMSDAVAALVVQKPTRETLAGMAGYLSRGSSCGTPEDAGRAAALQSCIQGLSVMFQHMASSQIAQAFEGGVGESLASAWRSPNACTRQEVVQCMAIACYRIGPRETSDFIHSMSLSVCQKKLLELYLDRMEAQRTPGKVA